MGALVGNALGARSGGERAIATQGLLYGAAASVVLFLTGQAAAPALVGLISEPGPARDAAVGYLSVLMWAMPAFLLAWAANGVLTAQGDTVSMSRAQIGAFLANLALNPLFIFGIPGVFPAMGFDGIALSTVACQMGVLAWILWRAARSDVLRDGPPVPWRPDLPAWGAITGQALPASAAMLVMMVAGFVVQFYLKDHGPEAQAAYGVALRIEQILLLPAFGLTGALLPIASQNFGAGNHARIREAAIFCVRTGGLLMLGAAAILWLGGGLAMSIFTDDETVIAMGAGYLAVDGFILPVYVSLFAINALLQAFRKPVWTLVVGIWRQGIAVALFVHLFSVVLDLGVMGVWYGIAAAVITGLVVSIVLLEWIARPLMGGFLRPVPLRAGA
jgi:Na+-driven multidrug efflux pump